MFRKSLKWFRGLTTASKTGVVIASVLGISAVGAATGNTPPKLADKPAVVQKEEATDVVTRKTITEKQSIAFESKDQSDGSLAKGSSKTLVEGVDGELTATYNVTYTNGVETSREKVSEKITRQPVTELIAVGTYVKPAPAKTSSCDPNYSGCVPIASDVDCGGGNGNGPAYVYETVRVTGYDIYDLDRDSDGYGCD